jgi:hypothetical protein
VLFNNLKKFANFFCENIFKIITSVPGVRQNLSVPRFIKKTCRSRGNGSGLRFLHSWFTRKTTFPWLDNFWLEVVVAKAYRSKELFGLLSYFCWAKLNHRMPSSPPPHTHKKTRRDYILISTVTHSHTISLYCELHNLYINNRIKFHTNCCNPLQKHSSFAQPQSKCLLLFL